MSRDAVDSVLELYGMYGYRDVKAHHGTQDNWIDAIIYAAELPEED